MTLRLNYYALLVLCCSSGIIRALALPTKLVERADVNSTRPLDLSVTTVSTEELSELAPYTQFARAAYCPSSIITGWMCGQACVAVPDFQPTLTGGDGDSIQLFYVGFWPSQNSVVVAHQGTDPSRLLAVLTDANLVAKQPDSSLFPGAPNNASIHAGFADEHAKTASTILAEVKRLISTQSATKVTVVGHSLGGALAELDTLFLTLNLPSNIQVEAVTYGTPRVGNPAYAAFFDSQVSSFKRVNNQRDIVPIVPGITLGYQHPQGEIHIVSPNNAVSCPGNDDASDLLCTIQTVPNVLLGNLVDHLGPYQGISIGTVSCT